MGNLFGKKHKKAESRVTEQDKAILQLKQQRDKLKQYQKKINSQLNQDREVARALLKEGKKDKAKLMLRKKKFQESLLTKTDGQLENIERLVHDLEFTQVEQEVVRGLEVGNASLKKMHQLLSLEDVERIMDETQEGIEKQREIDDLLSGGLTNEDEMDVLAELDQIIQQTEPSAKEDVALPDVPEDNIGEDNIENVNTFKYLGSLKTDSGDNTNDINARIGMAKKRMQDLVNIWKDKTLTLQLKIKIMKTLVWTVMTYGAEGWTIKKKQEKKINSAEMWFYRRLLRISWRERRTDQSILEELNEERKLLNKKRKLTFFGHTCRSKCTLMKNILQRRMEGKRQRGRPRINYFDNIKYWTQMTTREIYDVILERDVWRQMVHEAVRAANVLGSDAG
ncbi:charged multivesicular body protein 6 [Plakobranchus ocellatus]|uniref:Charged multivesicular body protein 6 n=1 Tax=Plakobranchus ocellatus TaxID=259542 RepID=A0AAV4A5I0_9GAST|nr:charged multivesicular body protein 6 [Plakobranchus ocellatus]